MNVSEQPGIHCEQPNFNTQKEFEQHNKKLPQHSDRLYVTVPDSGNGNKHKIQPLVEL